MSEGSALRGLPGLVIALPQGLNVSGVTTWAVRLANGLARRGASVGMILHPEPEGHAEIDMALDDRVRVFDARSLGRVETCGGDLSRFIPLYRDAAREMSVDGRVVMSPNLHGDCYGIVAALAQVEPELVRTVGWQHTDIVYDTRLLAHFAPMLERMVGVSDVITGKIAAAVGDRKDDVRNIPYGVEIPDACPARASLEGRPVRLLYPGRLEHEQKRIRALLAMARELDARGTAYEITFLGDGPAAGEIDDACAGNPRMRRATAGGPAAVREALVAHDAFVLASRYEGLSIAMLEALAHGCAPIVTAVRSGASQAIEDGVHGVLADAGPDDDDETAGRAMAEAVERALAIGLGGLGERAWARARDLYSVERHVETVAGMLAEIGAADERAWPASRACAFSGGSASGGGSSAVVPEGGRTKLARTLEGLAGEKVAIHGAGRHTIELADVLADAPCEIVCVSDDDPNKHGKRLFGWEIVAPARAREFGATHVVISTWLHESLVLERRGVYEQSGVRVVAVYAERGNGSDAGSSLVA